MLLERLPVELLLKEVARLLPLLRPAIDAAERLLPFALPAQLAAERPATELCWYTGP